MKKSMADFLTIFRIVCSIALLFCPVLSVPFYIVYIIAGMTDIFDGFVARKTKTVTDFGSKLDTVADFVLFIVCLIKLFPVLNIQKWIYIWAFVIFVIKVINIIYGYVKYKKFISVHSVMNKVTGVLLFILPFTINFSVFGYCTAAVCAVATFSALQELYFIIFGKKT